MSRVRSPGSGSLAGSLGLSFLIHAVVLGVGWQIMASPDSDFPAPDVIMIEVGPEGGSASSEAGTASDLRERLAALEAAQSALREQLDAVTTDRATLAERVEAERARTAELERELEREAEAARLLRVLETATLAEQEGELAAGREQLTVEQARASELERELEAARLLQKLEAETAAERQNEAAKLDSALAELTEELEAVRARKAELEGQLVATGRRAAELESRLEKTLEARSTEVSKVRATYERLVTALQSEISQKEIALHQAQERLTVTIVDRVLFPSGQATLTREGRRLIEKLGAILTGASDQRILIEGHTDDVPIGPSLRSRFPSNWELSTARATEVVKYLVREARLSPDRLSAAGRADTRPVASNDTENGRQQNRRIEIILLPPAERGESGPS